MVRIVGWHLPPYDNTCACGKPATVIVQLGDGITYCDSCRDCVPSGAADAVLDSFSESLAEAIAYQDDYA